MTPTEPTFPDRSRTLDRRTFAKAALGATIVGFHSVGGRWVSMAEAAAADTFSQIPKLDGTLLLDDASLAAYAQDFGQIVSERPAAVLRPGSVRDIARMLVFAAAHGVRVVGRGQAHTTYGQSQHPAGIVLDLTTFDQLGAVEGDTVTVGAGARWTDVLDHTLAAGMMPTVLPDYIGQTVGGTLSVGGIGAMSFRHGAQIDHVRSLRAVTGTGHAAECSPRRHRKLFDALLAGQGQVGVITEATLELVPAPATVRLYDLVYADLQTMLADIAMLIGDQRFDQMEAFAIPVAPGEWLYLLECVAFHDGSTTPDDTTLLQGLAALVERTSISDLAFVSWANRVSTPVVQPHPWIDLLLPMSSAATFIAEVQAEIAPIVAGDRYNLLLIPLRSSTFTRPLFRAPAEDLVIGFDTLRSLPVGTDVASVLAFNRRLYDRARELGGTQYPISAVDLDRSDWEAHYGDQWERLLAAKRRYDRCNTLAGGPDVLGYST